MALRIETWLLLSTALTLGYGCAEGASSNAERVRHNVNADDDASQDEPDADEEDAGEPEEEDAGSTQTDAAMDAGASKDAGSDSGVKDAGMDTGPAPMPEASTPDTGVADAGPDANRPPPAPLPTGKKEGEWTYVEPAGALCRDGSQAGYFYRKGDDNLMIFLNGSGACTDSFFCGITPKNVNESFTAETFFAAGGNLLAGPDPSRQSPPNEGVLKRDSRNPVGSWSMIFVPYCTGDVHAGSKPNATVAGITGQQQFVGYTNLGLYLKSIGPSFPDTQRVLLAGTGAGGFGALLNMERVQDFFTPQGAQVSVVTDSGIPFQDQFLAACLQKKWREMWNLDAIMPPTCTGCKNADGGGLALGLGTYLFKQKYKDRMMGGMVSSAQDDIIRLFFSAGINNCMTQPFDQALAMLFGPGDFTPATFKSGLADAINNIAGADRVGYYVLGTPNNASHMHLWRPRFYDDNGVGGSMANWLGDVIAGKATHRGSL
jgi:Pectinacetylesterase